MAPSVTWHLILREYACHEQFLVKFPTRYKTVNFQAQNFAITFIFSACLPPNFRFELCDLNNSNTKT